MNIYQYHQLEEKNQLDALDQSGVLIAEREAAFCRIKLYQVENFYVEIYHHTHFNVVVNINSFTNTDCLTPYLENINIDSLFTSHN